MALPRPRKLSELAGLVAGIAISPLFALGSALRGQRFFHPEGICFSASVKPADPPGQFRELGHRLSGYALVRLSAGMWRRNHRFLPDVLGFSIRFGVKPPMETRNPQAQDLLTASSRNLWTLWLDSLRTERGDFMSNPYFGMTLFRIEGHPDYLVRVWPLEQTEEGDDRYERIRNVAASGHARFVIELTARAEPEQWHPLVVVELQEEVIVDEQALLFTPFNDGLGIQPQGFIHFLRYAPYIVSRAGRRLAGRMCGTEAFSAP